jgi:hypothetical protein
MLGTSPPGLTARDFHPPSCIDPRDVFLPRGRQRSKAGLRKTQSAFAEIAHDQLASRGSPVRPLCCGEDLEQRSSPCISLGPSDAPSPDSCEGDCDKCEDCFEDHRECDEDEIQCVDNCDECLDEHDKACGQHGQVCTETCDDCDFSCFDCVDWSAFDKDKDLGLSFSVPLLEQDTDTDFDVSQDATAPSTQLDLTDSDLVWTDPPVQPVDLSMHHQCLQDAPSLWNGLVKAQFCPPAPNFTSQSFTNIPNLPSTYGCHPATFHNTLQHQQPLPEYHSLQSLNWSSGMIAPGAENQEPSPSSDALSTSGRVCQWLMPCGNTCSATFANTSDLRKHLKAIHCVKGMTQCSWDDCGASFATEAALTGHISKKHLSNAQSEEDGPFKCTFPGCAKSFMYKQVLHEHLASHSGANKTFCHICGQFLNSEGSNFRRHMASHRPKHQHMICKWHHLGCRRRFPRLDNLRRHEIVCKFSKKAALHHHHHHRHVGHQP